MPPSDPAASQAIPAEILQIATPSSVSLDPKSIQSLADNISYDALTKASLEAISQVQSGNSQLMKLLGG